MDADEFLEGIGALNSEYVPTLPNFIIKLKSFRYLWDEEWLKGVQEDTENVKVFLVGYPFDVGAINFESRSGAEQGPCKQLEILNAALANLREVLDTIRLKTDFAYHRVNLNKSWLKVYDARNIEIDTFDLGEIQKCLEETVTQIIEKVPKSIVLVIGGTGDSTLAAVNSLTSSSQLNVLNIDSALDVKGRHYEKEHHQSAFRQVYESKVDKLDKVIHFGVQGHKCTQAQVDWVNSVHSNTEIVYLNKDIRLVSSKDVVCHLQERLSGLKGATPTVAQINLSSVLADHCPGVSEPSPIGGFTLSEIEDIALNLGSEASSVNLRCLLINEYNPAIEKFRTGTLVHSLFVSFLIGLAKANPRKP